MRKSVLITVIILLAGAIAIYLFSGRPESGIRVVQIKGTAGCCNLTKNNFAFFTGNNPDSITAVPVHENDLLYLTDPDENFIVYRYRIKDGNHLYFNFEEFKVYLNNQFVSAKLDENNGSFEWLKTFREEEVSTLRSIILSDTIPEDSWQGLEKMAEQVPGIGIVVGSAPGNLDSIMKLFKPSWLHTGDNTLDEKSLNAVYENKQLELLAMDAENFDPDKFNELISLKTLIVAGLDSPTTIGSWKLPRQISSLEIIESPGSNLNFLKDNDHLKELNIVNCQKLNNIEAISNLTNLKTLNLIDCDSVPDLSPVLSLKALSWFSPPWNINQNDFDKIITALPELESVTLVKCKKISSLKVLERLTKLSSLSLIDTSIPSDSLKALKNLDYLAYSFDQEKDSLKLKNLKAEMPSTLIVPAEPFCLGTGWLLLFIPALVLSALAFLFIRKKLPGA